MSPKEFMKSLVAYLSNILLVIAMIIVAIDIYADEEVKGFWRVVDGKISHCLDKQNKLICSEFPAKQFSDRVIVIKVKSVKNG